MEMFNAIHSNILWRPARALLSERSNDKCFNLCEASTWIENNFSLISKVQR